MQITRVDIEKINDDREGMKNVLALVNIVFDYDFVIKDIKYKTGSKGEYLIFPKDYLGRDLAYPITNDMREYILKHVEEAYNNIL